MAVILIVGYLALGALAFVLVWMVLKASKRR